MKKFFATLTLVTLLTISAFSQSKTLIKSLPIATTELVIDIPNSTISTSTWDKNEITVSMTVELENEILLNSLLQTKRYNIFLTENEGKSILSVPNLAKEITIAGKNIREKIKIELKVPKDVNYTIPKIEQLVR